MRAVVVVNRVEEMKATQTTTMLVRGLAARGHQTFVAAVDSLALDSSGDLMLDARRVAPVADTPAVITTLADAEEERLALAPEDVVLLRTNPGRDERAWVHTCALELLQYVQTRGVRVFNDPAGLMAARSKIFLARLPEGTRPRTLITRSPADIRAFVAQLGQAVLKPVEGTRGQDVFFVRDGDPNLDQIADVITRSGYGMVQARVPHAERGDTRVVVMDGRPLRVDGHVAAVRRVPVTGELRSNIHRGASAQPAALTDAELETCTRVARVLTEHGIWLGGIDLMGGVVLETNVFATGGLRDAERFTGVDFVGAVVSDLESRS